VLKTVGRILKPKEGLVYLNGDDIVERLRLANGAGALVATIKGDNEGLPSLQELRQFIGDEKLIER